MKIIGIDPGLATMGIGLIESSGPNDLNSLDWLTITTKAKEDFMVRLTEIRDDFYAYLEDEQPELAVVEKIYFAKNEKTAIDVAHARGVLLQVLDELQIETIEITPLELKSAITGDGGADKRQVQEMLLHILKLQEIPTPDDAADGLALAVYGAISHQILV